MASFILALLSIDLSVDCHLSVISQKVPRHDLPSSSETGPLIEMTQPEQQSLRDELIVVQEMLMHQQRDLQQMHEVLLAQQTDIDALRKEIAQIRGDVETRLSEDRLASPDDDKPPHY